jgi:glycine cleavage system pyridoxal-binding protein P
LSEDVFFHIIDLELASLCRESILKKKDQPHTYVYRWNSKWLQLKTLCTYDRIDLVNAIIPGSIRTDIKDNEQDSFCQCKQQNKSSKNWKLAWSFLGKPAYHTNKPLLVQWLIKMNSCII